MSRYRDVTAVQDRSPHVTRLPACVFAPMSRCPLPSPLGCPAV